MHITRFVYFVVLFLFGVKYGNYQSSEVQKKLRACTVVLSDAESAPSNVHISQTKYDDI
jgi:hypothetical protein